MNRQDIINALNRVIASETASADRARAANPDDPYIGLMQMEDVESLEEAVRLIEGMAASDVLATGGGTDAQAAAAGAWDHICGGQATTTPTTLPLAHRWCVRCGTTPPHSSHQ